MRLGLILVLLNSCFVFAAEFEQVLELEAKNFVSAPLLTGPNHEVADAIVNNGFQNTYLVTSRFGEFETTGGIGLRIRIREIDALAYLEAQSTSEIFLEALKDAGIESVKTISTAFTQPVTTIKGIPAGLHGLFTGYVDDTKRGMVITKRFLEGSPNDTLDPKDFKELNYLVGDGERKWANELNVDPYSTNMKLRTTISNMSVVQFIGGLPVDFAIPVAGSLAVGVLEEIGEKIYFQDAKELEVANRACLKSVVPISISIDSDLDAFFAADYMTPTMHTMYCSAAKRLQGVLNVSQVGEQLSASQSFDESRFILSTLSLLAWYHNKREGFVELIVGKGLPYGITKTGNLVVMLPGDYLVWTEEVARHVDGLALDQVKPLSAKRDLWLLGVASKRTKEELAKRGWQLHDRNSEDQIRAVFEKGLAALDED